MALKRKKRQSAAQRKRLQRQTQDANEQLMISSVRQHELTEAAEKLNVEQRKRLLQQAQRRRLQRQTQDANEQLMISSVHQHELTEAAEKLNVEQGKRLLQQAKEANEQLIVSSLRQHELTEAAEKLNAQLKAEITERKRAEASLAERTARLEETIGELEHFSYTITHDMRGPLRAMQGFAGIMLIDCKDRLTPQGADYLRRIIDASHRMDALIQDSLQFAKVIRERIPLATVECATILGSVLRTYPALQAPDAKIKLVPPFPQIRANEAGLSQCFSNLLANAIKFVKPGAIPRVRIWAETRGDFVRFWFEDNGIGISPEYHDRIFGMFQQLHKSYEGTGIGLALVRKTAERMEGRVGVESEPGKGSRFWLEFKKADNPPTQ